MAESNVGLGELAKEEGLEILRAMWRLTLAPPTSGRSKKGATQHSGGPLCAASQTLRVS